jgi:hypothetical protein
MVWQDQSGGSWVWGLYPIDQNHTRLVSRLRIKYPWRSPFLLVTLPLMELGDPIMMRKELMGIKRRAEAQTIRRT